VGLVYLKTKKVTAMKLVRISTVEGRIAYGIPRPDGTAIICTGDFESGFQPSSKAMPIATCLPPLSPPNIIGIGLNYRQHARETKATIPDKPVVFAKLTTSVTGHNHPIILPMVTDPDGEVDYECELAVIIGKTAHNTPASTALDHVFGYTCANDVSARQWQKFGGNGQWVRGKSFDTFCPLGPWIVTADEIPDPQALPIRTRLNGMVMQEHTTADMIFTVAQLIHFLSQDTTLLPGTIILTGTPQGVGFVRHPPVWLKAGDSVSVEIDGIGTLTNPVVKSS